MNLQLLQNLALLQNQVKDVLVSIMKDEDRESLRKGCLERHQNLIGVSRNWFDQHSPIQIAGKHYREEEAEEIESRSETYTKRNQRQRQDKDQLYGDLRKIKPPRFDGEKASENDESWMLEMMKYLQLYNYSDNQEAQIAIYNLQGKEYRWWKHLK